MRLFEIILIGALFLSLALSTLSLSLGTSSSNRGLPANISFAALVLALVSLLIHLAREGAHWQMIPVYLAIVPVAALAWLASRQKGGSAWPWEIGGLLLLLAGCACCYAVPMFHLPAPTGPYAVGTTVLYLVDHSRLEDGAPNPGGEPDHKRELMVQLWYPTTSNGGKRAAYRRKVETTLESSYQALVLTNSYQDAPITRVAAPYPVLFFNPAWRGRRTQDTFLTEDLASHGYVVAAIDHTFNSMPVAFPDGRVISAQPVDAIEGLIHTTPGEVEHIGTTETDREALDVRFVLDELEKMNLEQGSPWFQTMDTQNAGSLGHSLGGAVSVEAWATDERIHAALNLDGWTFGTQAALAQRIVGPNGVKSPLLFLYEEGYSPSIRPETVIPDAERGTPAQIEAAVNRWDIDNVQKLIQRYGGYWLNLHGSIHATFTDKPITSPISRLSGTAPLGTRRAHAIIRDYTVQFFDQALKQKPSALLTGQQKYPEVTTSLRVEHAAQAETTKP
jgi:predicted dienelactone hydrolase